jgi:sec-independent protein translocase protein TatB
MIDLGISKLALIGVVALIVIGPEKLPRVARTVGTLLGKAQRYVSEVKAEVNRSMAMDELNKAKESVTSAAQEWTDSVNSAQQTIHKTWSETSSDILSATQSWQAPTEPEPPSYKHPGKNWRVKRSATPQWFKAHSGVRTRALSGAARVARYRPQKLG